MPESGTYGSVRGAPSNGRPYRDRCAYGAPATCPQPSTTELSKTGMRTTRYRAIVATSGAGRKKTLAS